MRSVNWETRRVAEEYLNFPSKLIMEKLNPFHTKPVFYMGDWTSKRNIGSESVIRGNR